MTKRCFFNLGKCLGVFLSICANVRACFLYWTKTLACFSEETKVESCFFCFLAVVKRHVFKFEQTFRGVFSYTEPMFQKEGAKVKACFFLSGKCRACFLHFEQMSWRVFLGKNQGEFLTLLQGFHTNSNERSLVINRPLLSRARVASPI